MFIHIMYSISPIAVAETPYKEKFAVPRQPRLVPSATARIKLLGDLNCIEAVRGIEQFTHLWVLFLFDQNLAAGWKPTVRPPRLGGNERVGVLASRSTFRPNGIGMSAVELRGINKEGNQIYLEVGSIDLVDQTPIVDIKPYIPYSDSIPDGLAGYAEKEPERVDVIFTEQALIELKTSPEWQTQQAVISEVLAQDPRPAYKKNKLDNKEYAVNLYDLNIKFTVTGNLVTVTTIEHF